MSFWKMLGGAVIGVGAVAAAPFTGGGSILGAATLLGSLAGAGTIAAAVGAGVAGAAVAASMDDDDQIRSEGFREGEKQAKAEQAETFARFDEKLRTALEKLKESAHHFNAIVALEAVAIAVASCDGTICEYERAEIGEFINGVSSSTLPVSVKAQINNLYEQPVNLPEAFKMARESGLEMSVFDEVITLVMHADGVIHQQENAFMQAWNQLKTA